MAKRLKRDKFYGLNIAEPKTCGTFLDFQEASAIKNIVFSKSKGVGMRAGRDDIYSLGSKNTSADYFRDYNGIDNILITSGGTIYQDLVLDGTAPTSVKTGLTPDIVPYCTSYGDFLWYCNGTDDNLKFDGTTWLTMGVRAPSAAPTAGDSGAGIMLAGDYQYACTYVYKNAALGYEAESRMSPIAEVTIAVNRQILITTAIDTTGESDTVRIYRRSSLAGEEEWKRIKNASTGLWEFASNVSWLIADNTLTDDLGDTPLYTNEGEPVTVAVDSTDPSGFTYTPLKLRGVTSWRSRLWGWKGAYLYHTVEGRPEKWWNDASTGAPNPVILIDKKNNQDIVACYPFQNSLVIFTEDQMFIILGTTEDEFDVIDREKTKGCIAGRSIQDCGGYLLWLAKDGVNIWNGYDSVEPMSDEIDTDFDMSGRGILDQDVEKLANCPSLYLPVEKLYWLSVPRSNSALNKQTYVYNFDMKPIGVSQWSVYDFGVASICKTNSNVIVSTNGYDGTYTRENYGLRDNGVRFDAYYETRAYNFDAELFDKRFLEITTNGSGYGYSMKFTTKVDVVSYGIVSDSFDMVFDGDVWGTDEPDTADDFWGTDEPDDPTDYWQGTPFFRKMKNYPQECCGLYASFRIDLAYNEDFDTADLWPDSTKFAYTNPLTISDLNDTYDIIKIDTDYVGKDKYDLDTARANYEKLIYDESLRRTFVLHYRDVDETTYAVVSIIDHKLPTISTDYIVKLNATECSGWPAELTKDYVQDMAYDPTRKRLAIACAGDGTTTTPPSLIIVDVDPNSAGYKSCVRWAPDATIAGCGNLVSGLDGYDRIKFVQYYKGRFWTFMSACETYPAYQLGYFDLAGAYTLCFQWGTPPAAGAVNLDGNPYDVSVCDPAQPSLAPTEFIAGTAYWGDIAWSMFGSAVYGMYVQPGGSQGKMILVCRPSNSAWGTNPSLFGVEPFIVRLDLAALIENDTPVAVESVCISVAAQDIGGVYTVTEGQTFYTPFDISSIRGACRVDVTATHTGAMSGVPIGDIHLKNRFGVSNQGPGGSASNQSYHFTFFADAESGAQIAVSYPTVTDAAAFTLSWQIDIYPLHIAIEDCIGIHSEEPLVDSTDTVVPETQTYDYRGFEWSVAKYLADTKYLTLGNLTKGCWWSADNEKYIFPADFFDGSSTLHRGVWTHSGDEVTRMLSTTSDLVYNHVGYVGRVDDDYYIIGSSENPAVPDAFNSTTVAVQLYKISDAEFDANEFTAACAAGHNECWVKTAFFIPEVGLVSFAIGDLSQEDEIWTYRVMTPVRINNGEFAYDVDESKLIPNFFLGFEVAYSYVKRPHI